MVGTVTYRASHAEKYFLFTAPDEATMKRLVFVTKMRWRVERDYQELEQEFGLSHYEGRGWQNFIIMPPCVSRPRLSHCLAP